MEHNKQSILEQLLDGASVLVQFDPRKATVPQQYASKPWQCVVRIGYRTIPAMNLNVDGEGVCADLSFGGKKFACVIPWDAIYALSLESLPFGHVFPEDVPDELIDELSRSATRATLSLPS